jgi:hypothetical protein
MKRPSGLRPIVPPKSCVQAPVHGWVGAMVRPVTSRLGLVLVGLACPMVLTPAVSASDSLSIPITSELGAEVWPLEVEVQIRDVSPALASDWSEPLPRTTIVIPDGHRTSWASAVWTPSGRRFFELDLVARHHPGDQVELEWDVVVSRSGVLPMDVGAYVLHRLQLGPKPRLGPREVEVARSDVVSTTDGSISEKLQIGDQTYEIRILAHSLRG